MDRIWLYWRSTTCSINFRGLGLCNDVEKQKRWEETEKWAQERGVSSILLDLTEENFYKVDELSD